MFSSIVHYCYVVLGCSVPASSLVLRVLLNKMVVFRSISSWFISRDRLTDPIYGSSGSQNPPALTGETVPRNTHVGFPGFTTSSQL